MKNLQLPLTRNWFELTKKEIKKEDYREITPYWCNRLLLFNSKVKSKEWWQYEFFRFGCVPEIIENIQLFCIFKQYNFNIMTLGYPKSTDKDRILKLEHKGIEIRTGSKEWGGEHGKKYFVIKHGLKIKN